MTQIFNWYGKRCGAGVTAAALGTVLTGLCLAPLLAAPAMAAPAVDTPRLASSSLAASILQTGPTPKIFTPAKAVVPSFAQPLLLAQAKKDEDELLDKDDDDDDDDKDLLKDDDDDDDKDLLKNDGEDKNAAEAIAQSEAGKEHAALFAENRYPSATTCGTCHPRHFEEWAVSQHSYAQLSPAYMALQNFINLQVNGTNGDFCIRCHNQVGMN
ncbi:MAG: multiheme c-type cytochrome, partial [Alphaproteobacteria bacterium]|nr:multiheme c-type cytochrome [Alphaproteobacteria bacterium]